MKVTVNALIIYKSPGSLTAYIVITSPVWHPCGIGVFITVGLIEGNVVHTIGVL